MHRALAIAEIVLITASECADDSTLPAFARTCRAFRDPALDLIWQEQYELLHLLKCMPDGLWETEEDHENRWPEKVYLTRPIVPADWDRFLFYSRRVKYFAFDVDSEIASCPSSMDVLRISFPGPVLFPNLRTLIWLPGTGGMIHHIRLLLAPRLEKLIMHDLDSLADLSLLPTLVTQCPALTDISIGISDELLRFMGSLYIFIVSVGRLGLSVPRVDSRALEQLSRLPTLTSLGLSSQSALPGHCLSSEGVIFPALSHLFISMCSADVTPSIVPLLTNAPLQHVNIHLPISEDRTTFVGSCAHNSFRHLSVLQARYRGVPPIFSAVHGVHIRPLFLFTELRVVRLYPLLAFHLDDSTVNELARAWPRIETLDLGGFSPPWSGTPSCVTLSALLSLAEHCLCLSFINLPLNASTQAPTPAQRIQQTHLTDLGVQSSPCADVHSISQFLSSVFPLLRTSLEGDPAARRQKWRESEGRPGPVTSVELSAG
ncbi:hypothetical protein FB45DRAFT_1082859 [Roridomyces roridus]|uniref:F-box domain-containing protein n=1 Tax=Roridomyces roridus TaxID=1738132 RepID=A0AAD7BQH7_9AGAR|nr:hypothetical protein FB45DRAFT_1082859 [Roridomyces roridus]